MAHGSVLLFQRCADARDFACSEDDEDDGDDDAHPPTTTIVNIAIAIRATVM
jgi:hypothetical protein